MKTNERLYTDEQMAEFTAACAAYTDARGREESRRRLADLREEVGEDAYEEMSGDYDNARCFVIERDQEHGGQ